MHVDMNMNMSMHMRMGTSTSMVIALGTSVDLELSPYENKDGHAGGIRTNARMRMYFACIGLKCA